MLRLARERDSLQVIDDQYGAPTGGELLADVTAQALRSARKSPDLAGLYHVAAAGETTWCQYARFVLTWARELGITLQVTPDRVGAITSAAYPTLARRPQNSRLNTNKLQQTFDLRLPDWQHGVVRMLSEVVEKQ